MTSIKDNLATGYLFWFRMMYKYVQCKMWCAIDGAENVEVIGGKAVRD